MACQCIKQQVGQGNGGVKGFITTQECEECRSAREQANIIAKVRSEEQAILAEKEALISAKVRELAVSELKVEGKLSEAEEVVKQSEDKVEPGIAEEII